MAVWGTGLGAILGGIYGWLVLVGLCVNGCIEGTFVGVAEGVLALFYLPIYGAAFGLLGLMIAGCPPDGETLFSWGGIIRLFTVSWGTVCLVEAACRANDLPGNPSGVRARQKSY